MLRALKFMLFAALALALAWWIGGLPGDVTAHSGPYTVTTSVPAAILLLALLAVLFTVLLRVLGGLRGAPGAFGAWRGGRRQKRGELATQRGLAALGAGDAAAARLEGARARKLLGDTPLVLWLNAEAARLANLGAEARAAFQQLAGHREMGFLGHRGLLQDSLAQDDHETAQRHAQAAERAYPGSSWLRGQRLELAVRQRNWDAALGLTRAPAEIAACATAAAQGATSPRRALAYAKQAVRAQATLAPSVVALATALRALGKPRAATQALLAGWKAAPNPLIAEAYFAPQTTPLARAQHAVELANTHPGHAESELVLAETALDAELAGEARRHAEAALAAGLTPARAAPIFAALDGKPAGLPSSALWVCDACHARHPGWTPVCPDCRHLGTLRWRQDGLAALPSPVPVNPPAEAPPG